MAEAKKINLSKFFKQDSASSSGVRARNTMGVIPQAQVVMSGRDLSEIVNVIQNTTEVNTYQKEYIRTDEKNDSILQTLVGTLQQRITGLQSSLFNLQSQFEQDLISRKRLLRKEEQDRIASKAEESEKISTAEPRQGLFSGADEFGITQEPEEYSNAATKGGILGAFAGIGAGLLGASGGGSGGSSAGAGVWKPLLDVIGSGEGGWNSVNPGQTVTGLSDMTIAEAWSTAQQVKGGSGAMGRYQFLSDPLGRARAAGLDPNKDKFSPENQDKMAIHIIENIRGGKQWLAGTLRGGEAAFAQGIADEWAGVPNLEGKFSYSGQGGKVKASSVKAALQEIKKTSSNVAKSETTPSTGQPKSTGDVSSSGTSSSTTAQETPPKQPQIEGRSSQVSQAVTSPTESTQTAGGSPIILPVNSGSPGTPSEVEISSGGSIPGGSSKNFSNFYPDVVRVLLGVFV